MLEAWSHSELVREFRCHGARVWIDDQKSFVIADGALSIATGSNILETPPLTSSSEYLSQTRSCALGPNRISALHRLTTPILILWDPPPPALATRDGRVAHALFTHSRSFHLISRLPCARTSVDLNMGHSLILGIALLPPFLLDHPP